MAFQAVFATLAAIGLPAPSGFSGVSAANVDVLAKPANNATAAAEIAVLCSVFMSNSLMFKMKKG